LVKNGGAENARPENTGSENAGMQARRDGRVVSVTGIERVQISASQEVMGSDGICKYLSCLSLILC